MVINYSRKLRVEICGSYSSLLKSALYSVLKGIFAAIAAYQHEFLIGIDV